MKRAAFAAFFDLIGTVAMFLLLLWIMTGAPLVMVGLA